MTKAVDIPGVLRVPYKGEILYNILLETHTLMAVNNMVIETLHPDNQLAKLYRDFTMRDRCILTKQINQMHIEVLREHNSTFKLKVNIKKGSKGKSGNYRVNLSCWMISVGSRRRNKLLIMPAWSPAIFFRACNGMSSFCFSPSWAKGTNWCWRSRRKAACQGCSPYCRWTTALGSAKLLGPSVDNDTRRPNVQARWQTAIGSSWSSKLSSSTVKRSSVKCFSKPTT